MRRSKSLRSSQLCIPGLAVLLPFFWPESCWGQDANVCNGSNASDLLSNGSNCTSKPCPQKCCGDNVRREAYLACKEYLNMGLSEEICRSWEGYAQTDCEISCSNCTRIALSVYGQCLFYLQTVMPVRLARSQCTQMRMIYEKVRCPAACILEEQCQGEEFDACEEECGNYRVAPGIPSWGCTCWRDLNKYGAPYECTEKSETGLEGLVAGGGGVVHSCKRKPRHCSTDGTGLKCSLYAYCPTDVCIVKNITCPWLDDCLSMGHCIKFNGKCVYIKRQEGERCTDGQLWSHSDSCVDGQCIGIEDKCMRYGVACDTLNSCLVPELRMIYDGNITNCDPGSGACMFKSQHDLSPCTSYPGGETDGQCRDGLCYRRGGNRCESRPTCPDLGPCHLPSGCDNFTGDCIEVRKTDGSPCEDDHADTYRDICIEGRCIGDHIREPTFQTMGEGDCINSMPTLRTPSGVVVDHTPIARYYADVLDSTACETQCRNDPECTAFSFGYHSCAIYGTTRKENPDAKVWGFPWQLERTRAHVLHPVTCWRKTEGATWDFVVYIRTFLFPITLCIMIGVPALVVAYTSRPKVKRSWRRVNGLPDESPSGSPRGLATISGKFMDKVNSSNSVQSFSQSREKARAEKRRMESDSAAIEDVRLGPTSPGARAVTEVPLADPRGEVVHAGHG